MTSPPRTTEPGTPIPSSGRRPQWPPRRARGALRPGRWLVGLAATLVVLACDALPWLGLPDPFARLNQPVQDAWSRLPLSAERWSNAARDLMGVGPAGKAPAASEQQAATPGVAVVAIDEGAIERVGRWPWDRIRLAQLVDELRRAGAKTIALDVLLQSDQRPRWTTDPGTNDPVELIHDDNALAAAIRAHGNVVLAMNIAPADAPDQTPIPPETLRALQAAAGRSAAAPPADLEIPGGYPTPPLPKFASAAARLADVNITGRHDPDAVLREIPIWSAFDGRLWPTLGLAAALAHENLSMEHVAIGPAGGVTADDLALLARRGKGQINQHLVTYPGPMSHWQDVLPDDAILSAGWLLEPALAVRDNLREAERMVRSASAEPFNLIQPDDAYTSAIAVLQRESIASDGFAAALQTVLPTWERLSTDAADYLTLFEGVEPADEQERLFHQGLLAFSRDLPAIAERLQATPQRIAERRAAARDKLAGKLVFIGWLETGAAVDVVATPIHSNTPGVIVHAAVSASILTGHQRADPPPWLDPVITLGAGLIGTLLAARLGVLVSPWLVLISGGALAALEGAFLWNDALLAVSPAPPLVAASLAWLAVTLFRLLIEQRARRRTEDRFKRYVSPDVVDILVANPAMNSMAPEQRTLTILFADLENFTALAERLGPRRTGHLLNDCLSRYTDVLLAHGATLDKYLGDGLMAFWGAPVETPDHARLAVEAALAMQRAQADMNISSAIRGGFLGAPAPSTPPLRLRIGIATGEVMVGDFGAPPVRSGYTVIGDAVNLASRLEGANRPLGAGVLIDAASAERVRHSILLRPMGRLRLRGRAEPEHLHEPLCPLAEATDDDRARAAAAAKLAECFAAADFPAALAAAAGLEADPRDRPLAHAYRAEIARWKDAPPSPDRSAPEPDAKAHHDPATARHADADTDQTDPARSPAPVGFDATLSLTDSQPLGNAHPK